MNRNVTLSANPSLLEKARKKAVAQKKTLNALFRDWLRLYVGETQTEQSYDQLMNSLDYAIAGRKFSRDEMNER